MVTVAPDRDDILGAWKKADEEQAFWSAHHAQLLERFPDQFVAVAGGAVVAAGPDLPQVIQLIESKGLELAGVWIRFIMTNPRGLML